MVTSNEFRGQYCFMVNLRKLKFMTAIDKDIFLNFSKKEMNICKFVIYTFTAHGDV